MTENDETKPTEEYVQTSAETPVAPAPTHPSTSGLAIAGLVLGILGILGAFVPLLNLLSLPLSIIGLALAIIGFVGIRKGKHTGKGIAIAGIVLGIIAVLVVALMYGGAAASSNASKSSVSASAAAVSQASSSSVASVASSSTSSSKYAVSIDSARLATDYSGKPVAVVKYTWQNNSDKDASFAVSLSPKCFQNGVQLEVAIMSEEIDNDGYLAQVKPGYGTTLEMAYELKDRSDVLVEVTETFDFSKKVLAKKTFKFND